MTYIICLSFNCIQVLLHLKVFFLTCPGLRIGNIRFHYIMPSKINNWICITLNQYCYKWNCNLGETLSLSSYFRNRYRSIFAHIDSVFLDEFVFDNYLNPRHRYKYMYTQFSETNDYWKKCACENCKLSYDIYFLGLCMHLFEGGG